MTRFVLFLLLAAALSAQTTDSAIVGDIVDPQNQAVPDASITITSSATGVQRTLKSGGNGQYRVFPLPPGAYQVAVQAAGFRTALQSDVVVAVAEQVKVDFRLIVGDVSESVQVTSDVPTLQTQDGSVGGIVTANELTHLPVNGRNYTSLMLLMPGTSDQGNSQSQATFSGTRLYSFNGQRQQDNNFTLDGVDNNFLYQKSPGSSPPMDSIEEFKVLNNTSAEFGRSPGANVNIAIKSGARDLHGSAYEYLRNDALDATDFFNNVYGTGKLPFRQNQYGISGGGPVILPEVYQGRNRTFWFTNWEGFRQRQGKLQVSNVPTLSERGGNFSDISATIYNPFTTILSGSTKVRQPFPGNVIPQSLINPAMAFYLNHVIPAPNAPGTINNLLNTSPVKSDRDIWVARLDHTFGPKDNLFFRYLHQDAGYISPYALTTVYSDARFDVRNVYELPFGRGRRFGSGWNRAANAFLGGWATEGILRLGTGAPLNIVDNQDRANVGTSVERPDLVGNPNIGGTRNTRQPWFNTAAFQLQPQYTFGNAGTNIADGPARQSWDAALQKSWKLAEGRALQFRGEFFNMLNHVNFTNTPSGNLQLTSPSFGLVTSAASARQIQLALRVTY